MKYVFFCCCTGPGTFPPNRVCAAKKKRRGEREDDSYVSVFLSNFCTTDCLQRRPIGPGPAHQVQNLNQYGKHHVTGGLMSWRFVDGRRDCGPGPAHYNVVPVLRANISPRMACLGPPLPPKHVTPAPNAYRLLDTLGHRSAHLGRRIERRPECPTPAPGYYDMPHADVYMPGRHRGGRSFGRPIAARAAADTPGPGHYDATRLINCCRCEPYGKCRITFGVRWPDTVPVFAVKDDDRHEC